MIVVEIFTQAYPLPRSRTFFFTERQQPAILPVFTLFSRNFPLVKRSQCIEENQVFIGTERFPQFNVPQKYIQTFNEGYHGL